MIAVYSARSSCPRPMLARQVVLPTPPNSSHPRPLLSRQQSVGISPLSATLMDLPASVANKRLTARLNPLDATLTKNTGAHPSSQKPFYLLALPPQTFRRSNLFWLSPFFLFIHLQMPLPANPYGSHPYKCPGGMGSRSPKRPTVSSRCTQLHRRLHPSLCIQSLCYPPLSAFGELPYSFYVGGRHE